MGGFGQWASVSVGVAGKALKDESRRNDGRRDETKTRIRRGTQCVRRFIAEAGAFLWLQMAQTH